INDPLTMYLGMRYDHYKKGEGTFWSTETGNEYNTTSDSATYNEISPKIALDYKADDNTSYYISYGHSFNPPEMYKIYRYSEFTNYWYVPNPALKPEASDTFEIGMRKKLSDKTNLGVTLYHVNTDDKIAASGVLPGEEFKGKGVKKYMNYNKEKRKGIELELSHKFNDKFSGYFNYAWQQGKLETGGKESTNYDIPKHLLHAGINYNYDKWNALLDCQYVSERQAPDETSGYGAEEAYFLVNAAVNYEIAEDMTLQFSINNLFDREFYASEATAGRTYNLGLRYSF
ncbi:MAG: TonB-dependent receptor domain-containing protein, partial [bacterium]